MLVKHVMVRDVGLIDCGATLQQATERMRRTHTRVLLVCNRDRFVALLTDRSVKARLSRGIDPELVRVREAIDRAGAYCFEDQTVDDAIAIMREEQVRRLAVLTREHRPNGLVSLFDDLVAYASIRQRPSPTSRHAWCGQRHLGSIAPTR